MPRGLACVPNARAPTGIARISASPSLLVTANHKHRRTRWANSSKIARYERDYAIHRI